MSKDKLKHHPLKEMILEGLKKGLVKIIQNPNDNSNACQIGEFWFYFIGSEDEALTPDEVFVCYTKGELADLIYDAMKGLRVDEFNYYRSFLEERI